MKSRLLVLVLLGGAAAWGVASWRIVPSAAQQPWSWPEHAKDLQVLPKDTDAQKLRAVMMSFTRALGVRCSHCHVGKEGQPLAEYDFPSNDNPKKEVTRGMMRMVDSINVQLRRIRPDSQDLVTVSCVTCHRGLPRPRTLMDELRLVYDKSGPDSAMARYRVLRTGYYGSGSYDFGEGALGELARYALEKKDAPGAVAILRINVEQFPQSGFVHGSLADAYLATGDTTRAISEYERTVQLDPRNERAARTLERLRKR